MSRCQKKFRTMHVRHTRTHAHKKEKGNIVRAFPSLTDINSESSRTIFGLRRPQSKSLSLYAAPSTHIFSLMSSLVVSVSLSYNTLRARARSNVALIASIHASLCLETTQHMSE